jgi:hypothetical protein
MTKKDKLTFTLYERNHGLEFQSYNDFFNRPFTIWMDTERLEFRAAGYLDPNAKASKGFHGQFRFMLPIPTVYDGIIEAGNYRFDSEDSDEDTLIHYFGE